MAIAPTTTENVHAEGCRSRVTWVTEGGSLDLAEPGNVMMVAEVGAAIDDIYRGISLWIHRPGVQVERRVFIDHLCGIGSERGHVFIVTLDDAPCGHVVLSVTIRARLRDRFSPRGSRATFSVHLVKENP